MTNPPPTITPETLVLLKSIRRLLISLLKQIDEVIKAAGD